MNLRGSKTAAAACLAVLVTACGGVTQGRATSPLYDPFRVAGLPAQDGPSGVRANAPPPVGDVQDTDGGDVDALALLAVNDVADFWTKNYARSFGGAFTPIANLQSWNSEDPSGGTVCGNDTYDLYNALFCPPEDLMAWDRGVLVPVGRQFFGETSIAALLGHEYGHAIQHVAGFIDARSPTIVFEQQADCFAGVWAFHANQARSILEQGDVEGALAADTAIGDDTLQRQSQGQVVPDSFTHGTSAQRVRWFSKGLQAGQLKLCDTFSGQAL